MLMRSQAVIVDAVRAADSFRPTQGRIAANHRLSNLNCPWHPQNRTRKTIS
jgi:hypothetical protein